MVNKKAFTLLEVVIALSISTFIVFGMIQIYRNLTTVINRTRNNMVLNRKVCLLFDQITKDISTAYIPQLHKEETKEAEAKKAGKQEAKEEKKDNKFFLGEIYEDEYRRIEGKKWELFKKINFITTNPLEVYSEKKVRLVRVMYELIKNKQASQKDKISYDLYRKETYDLENFRFKEPEESFLKEKKQIIRKYLVANYIKDFYSEYVTFKPKKDKGKEDEEEEVRAFVWGDKKDTQDVLPSRVDIQIVFWDENLVNQSLFKCMIPVVCYPTPGEEEKKPDETQPATQPSGTPAAPPQTAPAGGPGK